MVCLRRNPHLWVNRDVWENKTQRCTAFNMPPLLLLLSLLCAPVPIFAPLTPYSFRSPLQPPWFLHYFQQILPVGLTGQMLIFLLLPMYLPIPGGWKILAPRPLQHLLAFPVLLLLGIFFTFLDSVFCLIFLSSDSKLLST